MRAFGLYIRQLIYFFADHRLSDTYVVGPVGRRSGLLWALARRRLCAKGCSRPRRLSRHRGKGARIRNPARKRALALAAMIMPFVAEHLAFNHAICENTTVGTAMRTLMAQKTLQGLCCGFDRPLFKKISICIYSPLYIYIIILILYIFSWQTHEKRHSRTRDRGTKHCIRRFRITACLVTKSLPLVFSQEPCRDPAVYGACHPCSP